MSGPIVLTTPPAWTKTPDITRYGGHVNKRDFMDIGEINPLTDYAAKHICRTAADIAAAIRTATFVSLTLTCRDTGALNPLVHNVAIQSGDLLETDYNGGSPPAGYPTVTRVSNGVILVTLENSYLDPYGTAGSFKIRFPKGCAHGSAYASVNPEKITDTSCKFYVNNSSGVVIDRKLTVILA